MEALLGIIIGIGIGYYIGLFTTRKQIKTCWKKEQQK